MNEIPYFDKKARRDKYVNAVTNFLDNNKIEYENTITPNVVEILGVSKRIIVSLNSKFGYIKVKFVNGLYWYTYKKPNFLEHYNKLKVK